MLVARADQRQCDGLRQIGLELLAGQRTPQVLCERRALAHRIHPGLGAGMPFHRRHVASGEYVRVRARLQRLAHQDKPTLVGREPGLPQPGWRAGSRGPHDVVRRNRPAVGQTRDSCFDLDHAGAHMAGHVAGSQHAFDPPPHTGGMSGQDRVGIGHDAKGGASIRLPRMVLHGQRQLRTTRTAAHGKNMDRTAFLRLQESRARRRANAPRA